MYTEFIVLSIRAGFMIFGERNFCLKKLGDIFSPAMFLSFVWFGIKFNFRKVSAIENAWQQWRGRGWAEWRACRLALSGGQGTNRPTSNISLQRAKQTNRPKTWFFLRWRFLFFVLIFLARLTALADGCRSLPSFSGRLC